MGKATARGGIAMYIARGEMERRGLSRDAAGYAAVVRDALRCEGVSPRDLLLEVFETAAGTMLFCRLR